MELNEFIPYYPSISSTNFYNELVKKKEFYDLRHQDMNDSSYFSHQKIIARFISNWTLYNSVFLIHETGTGKSGVACACFDRLKLFNPNLKCLYISNNDTLLENFKNEIFNLSIIIKEKLKNQKKLSIDEIFLRNSILKECGFEFITYYRFASQFSKSNKKSYEFWNNQLIILDEVHHLTSNTLEIDLKATTTTTQPLDVYSEIVKFLDHLSFKKLLVMTATPMRNSPDEIAPLLNIVLKPKNRFNLSSFVNDFFNLKDTSSGISLYSWKSDQIRNVFITKIKGYISFVKQNIPFPIVHPGLILSPMNHYRLFTSCMEKTQMTGYINAYTLDHTSGKDVGFYNNCQQASLFVFPDLSFGIKDSISKYFKNNRFTPQFIQESKLIEFKSKSRNDYTSKDIKDLNHNLNCIKQFSCIYHSIISLILLNNKDKHYIYCDKINGSGIILCIQLLNQFFGYRIFNNFSNLKQKSNENIPRLVFLHETIQKSNIPKIIETFNDIHLNKNGQLIQLVFGTDKTREGISLKQIEHIHIASPDWNFGKMNQAIGRGIRATSHLGMDLNTKIKIYYHCSLPLSNSKLISNKSLFTISSSPKFNIEFSDSKLKPCTDIQLTSLNYSIDFFQYYRSELKDRNIKLLEYTLLQSAFDCFLNKWRNQKSSLYNFKPECMYQSCNYDCIDINPSFIKNNIDYSTYNLFYIEEEFHTSIPFIQSLFFNQVSLSFQQIIHLSSSKHFTLKLIIDTLALIIDKPISIPFYDGRSLFLNQCNDIFYLINSRIRFANKDSSQLWIISYSFKPIFISSIIDLNTSLSKIFNKNLDNQFQKICSKLQILYKKSNILEAKKLINNYMTIKYQLEFLKQLIITQTNFSKWILFSVMNFNSSSFVFEDINKNQWIFKDNNWFIHYDSSSKSSSKSSFNSFHFIDHNPFGFYGIISRNKFKLRDISDKSKLLYKKTNTSGKECKSHDFVQLLFYLFKLDPNYCHQDLEAKKKTLDKKDMKKLLSIAKQSIPILDKFINLVNDNDPKKHITWEQLIFIMLNFEYYDKDKNSLCKILRKLLSDNSYLFIDSK